MPGSQSAIPVGTQFSPDLIDLPAFLAALVEHSGNKAAIEVAIWSPAVRKKPKATSPTRRNSSLPVEAAVQYGLLDKSYRATPLAERLARLQPPGLYDEFARHILRDCGGLRVVEAVRQMEREELKITGDTLAQYLTDQGFPVTVHNTAINSMRMWLAKAGVFSDRGWEVNNDRKQELLQLGDNTVAALVGLNPEQLAFIEALCRIDPQGLYPAASVRVVAAQILGRSFGQASLPQAVLEPLKRAGLIEYHTKGTSSGKTSMLQTLPAFKRDVLEAFIKRTIATLDPALTAYFLKRPTDIYADMASNDTFIKGQALEAYAIYLLRLLGLRFVDWRKRGQETGGAEIDAVMTGTIGAMAAVWQIQCKNTPGSTLRTDDVAKEVGLLPLTKATHILILVNGRISGDARRYADDVVRNSPTTIFLIDKGGFDQIKADPADLFRLLREQAERITRLRHDRLLSNLRDVPTS